MDVGHDIREATRYLSSDEESETDRLNREGAVARIKTLDEADNYNSVDLRQVKSDLRTLMSVLTCGLCGTFPPARSTYYYSGRCRGGVGHHPPRHLFCSICLSRSRKAAAQSGRPDQSLKCPHDGYCPDFLDGDICSHPFHGIIPVIWRVAAAYRKLRIRQRYDNQRAKRVLDPSDDAALEQEMNRELEQADQQEREEELEARAARTRARNLKGSWQRHEREQAELLSRPQVGPGLGPYGTVAADVAYGAGQWSRRNNWTRRSRPPKEVTSLPVPQTEGSFKCPYCEDRFLTRWSQKYHTKHVHPDRHDVTRNYWGCGAVVFGVLCDYQGKDLEDVHRHRAGIFCPLLKDPVKREVYLTCPHCLKRLSRPKHRKAHEDTCPRKP